MQSEEHQLFAVVAERGSENKIIRARNPRDLVAKIRKEFGLVSRPPGLPRKHWLFVSANYRALGPAEIARRLGVHKNLVIGFARDTGLTARNRDER